VTKDVPSFARACGFVENFCGREYSAAVLRVEVAGRVVCEYTVGQVTGDSSAVKIDPTTRFDLASLTKPFVATAALDAVADGMIELDESLAKIIVEWRGTTKSAINLRHLLAHTSGMRSGAHYRTLLDRQVEHFALTQALAAGVGERVVYSDLGFIALGVLLSRIHQRSLESIVGTCALRLGASTVGFRPQLLERTMIPATECDAWRGRVHGIVHDEKCHLMGGVSGHAGLFGTADDVARVAEAYLAAVWGRPTPLDVRLARMAIEEQGSDPVLRRGFGWALKTTDMNACGTRMSRATFGHTGFTGTSVWVDPSLDCSIVLLTNAVYFGRRDMRAWRCAIHDAVIEEVLATG
jgi:CubicO group peptidase (beta-lactamase class C family)